MSVIQVVAKYETNRDWTYEGDTIQFTDLSTGNANSWKWTFDGGTPATSTEQNPKVVYNTAGTFGVSFTVSNGDTEGGRSNINQVEVREINGPPYEGTAWIEGGMFTEDDPSIYQSIKEAGQDLRLVYDRRDDSWSEINARIFEATFEGGKTIDMQVNPEIAAAAARTYAEQYARYVGQVPRFLLKDVETVTIHDGLANFGGGNGGIDVYLEQGEVYLSVNVMEEIMFHEAAHVTIQYLQDDDSYLSARRKDPTYLSTYARDNLNREDVAESIAPYLVYRYYPERLHEDMKYIFSKIIPNRIAFFDQQDYDIYPLKK
ncbi:MAG: hypothetical protein Sapg2KO_30890 [Saprospiraceae bacterium]